MPNPAELAAHHWGFAAFLLGVVGLLAFMLGVSSLLGSKAFGRSKNEPFESGYIRSWVLGEVRVAVLVSDENGNQPIACEMVWAWVGKKPRVATAAPR